MILKCLLLALEHHETDAPSIQLRTPDALLPEISVIPVPEGPGRRNSYPYTDRCARLNFHLRFFAADRTATVRGEMTTLNL